MLHLKNFKEYSRADTGNHYENAIFLQDDSGEDWYDVLPKFQNDTWKVVYDSASNVVLAKQDVSQVNPNTFSVLEVQTLPDNFALTSYGKYQVVDGAVVQVLSDTDERAAMIRACRNRLLQNLDTLVSNPVRYASYSDAYKQALIDYRQALLDVSKQPTFPQTVTWPTLPTEE